MMIAEGSVLLGGSSGPGVQTCGAPPVKRFGGGGAPVGISAAAALGLQVPLKVPVLTQVWAAGQHSP